MDAWLPFLNGFGVAIAIGLVIGIERERSHSEGSQALGVRSFTLISVLGAIAASFQNQILQAVITLFVFSAILAGYWRSSTQKRHIGLTTEIAAGLVFALGFWAIQSPLSSAVMALVTLTLLLGRERIHSFARVQLKTSEIRAFVILLIVVVGLLPALPNSNMGPYGLFNPQRFAILFCLISALQFGGYIANRIFGHSIAAAITGFFGGLVSSTLLFLVSARSRINTVADTNQRLATCLMSHASSHILLFILIVSSHSSLALKLAPLLLIGILSSGIGALYFHFQNHSSTSSIRLAQNPLDWRKSLELSLMLFCTLWTIGFTKEFLGNNAVSIVSFLGGLFELHSVSLANLNLLSLEKASESSVALSISLAILGSIVSKLFIVMVLARGDFRKKSALALLLILVMSSAALAWLSGAWH